MSVMMDHQEAEQYQQQQTFKHYCRICKKGFGCGRALGGHMRAHGIIDEHAGGLGAGDPDEDASGCNASEWDDKLSGSAAAAAGTKRMYALRTNPNRLKTCRICENCGKEFLTWQAFVEHGKCSSDDEGVDESPPSSPMSDDDLIGGRGCGAGGWSKGKRSRRTKVVMNEEEDLANCLVMLSSARVEPAMTFTETEESCASASKEDDQRQQAIPIATALAMETAASAAKTAPTFVPPPLPSVPRGMFECKACKKVFSSHQALGGHRASHKKVKGCFAAKQDEAPPPLEEEILAHDHKPGAGGEMASSMSMAIVPLENAAAVAPLPISPLKKKAKVHECSICHRVFTSGQALGGHKRCHWITSNSPDPNLKLLHTLPDHNSLHHQLTLRPMFEPSSSEPLDLNMPATDDVRRDIGSSLRLDMPASIYLRSWIDGETIDKNRETSSSEKNNDNNVLHSKDNNTDTMTMSSFNLDDEVDSKVKLQKLSELKDINMGGDTSPWLQVGIGSSSANEGSDPA